MDFAIYRFEKVKNLGSLSSQQKHVLRAVETPNASPKYSPFNRVLFGSPDAFLGVKERVAEVKSNGKKIRKDSVLACEVLLTASPEFFKPRDFDREMEWLKENVKWLREEFGDENVVQAVVHFDESTPHIHAVVFPRTKDGRLSCFEVFGGPQDLAMRQTRYAKAMEKFGLQRGISKDKTKRNHEEIRTAYGKVLRDSEESLKYRITRAVSTEYRLPHP